MKKSKDVWIAAAGVLLMMVGAGLLGRIEPLAYVCIGLGAGLFGQGTGELVSRWALRNSPEIRKQLEIAQKDERNQAIASQAKSKAFDKVEILTPGQSLRTVLKNFEVKDVWGVGRRLGRTTSRYPLRLRATRTPPTRAMPATPSATGSTRLVWSPVSGVP